MRVRDADLGSVSRWVGVSKNGWAAGSFLVFHPPPHLLKGGVGVAGGRFCLVSGIKVAKVAKIANFFWDPPV